jgi:energy-coupling factor transporter ATP-binding protein EcfA2
MTQEHFTSVHFHHFKAFRDYSLSLGRFNVLVGPNNSGKSTVLGAFRILAEAFRKARSRNPELVPGPRGTAWGYYVDLREVPIATENVFYDYDDTTPASVRFRISNGNQLLLYFPERGRCYLICETRKRAVTSTATFKSQYMFQSGLCQFWGRLSTTKSSIKKRRRD